MSYEIISDGSCAFPKNKKQKHCKIKWQNTFKAIPQHEQRKTYYYGADPPGKRLIKRDVAFMFDLKNHKLSECECCILNVNVQIY